MFGRGDFTIDHSTTLCSRKQLYDDKCFNIGVTSTEPTRIFTFAHNVSTTFKINYILKNANSSSVQGQVFDVHLSDHKIITLDHVIEKFVYVH